MSEKLTIVVPTKGRFLFLKRLLEYYASVCCTSPILIGDSSEVEDHERLMRFLDGLRGVLKVVCKRFPQDQYILPGQGTITCSAELMEMVQTPYVVWNPDDDFLIPSALTKAVHFLENHADYSAACGSALMFVTSSGEAYGHLEATSAYNQGAFEDKSASRRLLNFLDHYSTTDFSIKRTRQALSHWQILKDNKIDSLFGETFLGCLLVAEGKIRKMDTLYLVRQAHVQMTSRQCRNFCDFLISEEFSKQFSIFRRILLEKFIDNDGVTEAEAGRSVREAFLKHLIHTFSKSPSETYPFRLRKIAKTLPGLKHFWQIGRSFLPSGKMTLPALLRPSSLYHADFMPVYRRITARKI